MNLINKKLFAYLLLAIIVFAPVFSFAQSGGTNPTFSGQTGLSGNPTGQNGLSGNPTGQTGLSGNPTGQNLVSSDGKIKNPISYNNINDFIKAILQGAIKIGIPIIALAIIYSGFLFVSARGNSEKLSEAKNALLYTCLGAAILLGAWAIAQLISETILAL